ncbi:uncharacterized protein M421DRAFT_1864 [Didymella exigua CBS 183.55]|uniref:Uncharacterized protein n=1 Tax=Didymella exigua CBS 183.55 TaxID=1150837 RepID=A0A6A5S3Y5_9PLEO|nr:uncharacterized protein M421DRAFT_1864 [Didymella exigua CBS 183.55]KAF1932207.1 hypothetical protein M421DRAFT_1864 [Didymella exigua CBS 183.55]
MDYYRCSDEALRRELDRRHFATYGNHDLLSEQLRADDDAKGSEATTVTTRYPSTCASREINLMRTAEFGQTVPATQLVNQRIIYWNLNTFFPALQLFFESGSSCTIDGGRLPGAVIGLDPQLRFRLTDCTHEEQGRFTKCIVPDKFAHSSAGIKIVEATVAQRTSVAAKSRASSGLLSTSETQHLDIMQEAHTVVGLRLSGMTDMGYVWAKTEAPSAQAGNRKWGDVRLAGLRNDTPASFLGLPADLPKPGGELMVVEKGTMIMLPAVTPSGLDRLGRPWI